MKAAVVHGAGDLRLDERPDPVPQEGEVLIRVEWGGICGSDLSYVRSGTSGTATMSHPLALGHEMAGHIVACGEGTSPTQLGSPVAVMPATLPATADPQIAPHLHPEGRYLGSAAHTPHTDGGFSELLAVREDQALPLPSHVETKHGALAEPLAVALHAIRRAEATHGGALPEGPILINGCGPIGLLILAALSHRGGHHVIASDISADSLSRAARLGAAETVDPRESPLPSDAALCFEASGAPAALGTVLAAAQRGGTVIQVGNLPSTPSPAALGNLVSREITWIGSFRFADEMASAIGLLADGLDISPVISHEFALHDARQAFDAALDPETPSAKVMLRMPQR